MRCQRADWGGAQFCVGPMMSASGAIDLLMSTSSSYFDQHICIVSIGAQPFLDVLRINNVFADQLMYPAQPINSVLSTSGEIDVDDITGERQSRKLQAFRVPDRGVAGAAKVLDRQEVCYTVDEQDYRLEVPDGKPHSCNESVPGRDMRACGSLGSYTATQIVRFDE